MKKRLTIGTGIVALVALLAGGLWWWRDGSDSDDKDDEAAGWERVDDTTIKLTGDIEEGNFEEFKEVFDDRVKKVQLDSGGGSTYEALQIARELRKAGVDTEAVALCASSCANYLFTAGERRIINGGIVAYHGNTTALVNSSGGLETLIDEQVPDEYKDKFRKQTSQAMDWEKDYFGELGIDQELFDRTQEADKGLGAGKDYGALLPTHETFEQYGITNVEGEQNKALMEKFNKEHGYEALVIA